MNFLRSFALIFFLVVVSDFVLSQSELYRFNYLTTRNGLSQNHVNCIFQDRDGYIWIGTYNGLNRYDGYNIKIFRSHIENNSLSQDAVNVVFQDTNGNLWIGTDLGLNKYDPLSDKFTNYYNLNPDSSLHIENNIRTIYEDDDGLLWIGFYGGGLKLFDPESGQFLKPEESFDEEILPGHAKVNVFYEDKNGHYWIGTENFGLLKYNHETGELKRYLPHDKPGAISDSLITSIAEDKHGNLWVGTWNGGINIYYPGLECFKLFRPGNTAFSPGPVTSVYIEGDIAWIGTLGKGVYRFDFQSKEITGLISDKGSVHGLNNNIVWDVFQDRSGVVWLGTYGGGVNLFYPGSGIFHSFRAEPDDDTWLKSSNVSALVELSADSLLIGTLGGGLTLFDRRNNDFTSDIAGPDLSSANIRCLFCDRDEKIWVSSDKGLYRLNKALTIDLFFPYNQRPHGIGDKSVYAVFQDNRGDFWFGLWGDGVHKLEYEETLKSRGEDMQFKSYENENFVGNSVWDFYEDRDGTLWMGAGNGLFKYLPGADSVVFQPLEGLTQRVSVSGFYEDVVNNRLVMGTQGKGVVFFDLEDHAVFFVDEDDGLLNDEVLSIHYDSVRDLWICTSNGLSRYDIRNNQFRHLNVEMGMQENELLNKSWLLSTGEVFVGSNNGFYLFNPGNLIDSSFEPNIVITDFWVNNQEEEGTFQIKTDVDDYDMAVDIKPRQNTFSVAFAALDYRMSGKIEYQYKLEGFDDDWTVVHAGNRRATYTNMEGGDYVFRVKASNSDGLWIGKEKTMLVSINAPFYKRLEFNVLFAFVLLSLLYGLFMLREKKIKSDLKKRNDIFAQDMLTEERNILEQQRNQLEKDLQGKHREFAAIKVFLKDKEERLLSLHEHIFSALDEARPEVRKRIKQLLGRIEREAESEETQEKYIENLNIIHDGFVDRLANKFPKITQKDLMICSYIKSGKSNKEMASQLGISTHSVEMSRYRIRKKMVIDSCITLNDFLIRF
jgi:ligand-binding sensor domain-containing protein